MGNFIGIIGSSLVVGFSGWLFTNVVYPLKVMLLLKATNDPRLFENITFPKLYPLNSEVDIYITA